MSDWPTPGAATGAEAISPWSNLSVGSLFRKVDLNTPASAAWPSANRAIFVPFRLPRPYLITQAVIGEGSTGTGNFDVGIYDAAGNRLVSSGATAKGANTEHVVGLTDTYLGSGLYYMAMAADGANNYIANTPSAALCKCMGIKQADTAYTLPSTVTYATVATGFVPTWALYGTAL